MIWFDYTNVISNVALNILYVLNSLVIAIFSFFRFYRIFVYNEGHYFWKDLQIFRTGPYLRQ